MIEVIAHPPKPRPLRSAAASVHEAARRSRSVTVGDRFFWPAWTALNLGFLAFVLNARSLLPAKFFYDAGHIQVVAQQGLAAGKGDQSFIAVGEVYNVLGLADSLLLTNIASWVAITVMHAVALRRLRGPGGTPVLAIPMFVVSVALCCVFLTSYSKDAVVLIVAAVVLFAGPSLVGEIAVFGALALYASSFRNYWVLVIVIFAALRVVYRFVPHRWAVLLVPPLLLALLAIANQVATGHPIDSARALANAGRVGSADAASLIPTYIPLPPPLGAALNTPVTWLSLMAPLPLLVRGSAYYAVVAILVAAIWGAVVVCVLRRPQRRPLDRVATRGLLLALAFVSVQAIFEPDYGSALRHLSPLLILIAFGVGRSAVMSIVSAPVIDQYARHRA